MKQKNEHLRRCVGCGEMKPKTELIRVVSTADEGILIDRTGRKNGRGAYLCANGECLKKAEKNKGLEKSLKTSIGPEIYEALQQSL